MSLNQRPFLMTLKAPMTTRISVVFIYTIHAIPVSRSLYLDSFFKKPWWKSFYQILHPPLWVYTFSHVCSWLGYTGPLADTFIPSLMGKSYRLIYYNICCCLESSGLEPLVCYLHMHFILRFTDTTFQARLLPIRFHVFLWFWPSAACLNFLSI